MKTKLYTKLPVYKPSEKVWQNIEKELNALHTKEIKNKYPFLWSIAASFILIFFVTLFMSNPNQEKNTSQNVQITYSEEKLDTLLTKTTKVTDIHIDSEIENLCEVQPVKCQDEYAQSLLKQIQDLSNASSELEENIAGQSIPDADMQKQKAHIEKEKYKRIKKLKRYLNQ